MASLKPFFQRNPHLPVRLAYVFTVALFAFVCSEFYIPGKGFTYLVQFGSLQHARYLPELQALNHFEQQDSPGYDAQYYAQIAMRPRLGDQALKDAVDSLPYRARRILFSWTAYALGGGDPARALHIFAVQSIACWLLLALVLLRWFPATDWENFLRWFAVLFSFGMCYSVRGALVDGPSLLLIAVGVALIEKGRPWWGAVVLGVAGLGKETNMLANVALPPPRERTVRGWAVALGRGALSVLPLAVWLVCISVWIGRAADVGARNFDWPFVAFARKWADSLNLFLTEDAGIVAWGSLLMLVAALTQWLFFALRPRWGEPWWRIGAAYAVLMVFLGDAVWEDYPGAALRVLLPMTLAFNLLAPRGRRWLWLLVLGNLSVVLCSDTLRAPGRDSAQVTGPRELRIVEPAGQVVEVMFDETEWYWPEKSRFEFWRWARASASVTIRNPQPFAVVANVTFTLKGNDERRVVVKAGGKELWSGGSVRERRTVKLRALRLEPGDTVLRFETDRPPMLPPNGDQRGVTFSLRDFTVELTGRAK